MTITYGYAGAERLDDVEAVWRTLHDHHIAIDHERNASIREGRQTWELRRSDFAKALAQPDAFLVLAEDAGGVVGFALVHFRPNENWRVHGDRFGELETLAVRPDLRGNGVGRELMQHVYERMRALEVAELSIVVVERNEDARRFYEREGFLAWHTTYFGPVPAGTTAPEDAG